MRPADWNQLRAFHATAATGSLSAAARRLALTQPTLSRQVAALEEHLGLPLFDRRGRRLVLTQAGRDLLEQVGPMGDAAEAVALVASGRIAEIGGRVRISATDSYSAYLLPPMIERIQAEAPQIRIEINAANKLSDLHRLEADIAIRHVPPDRPGLVGQHIRDTEAGFYAAESWVARSGLPTTPEHLARAGLIGIEDAEQLAAYLRGIGIPVEAADIRLASDSSVTVWEMARRGIGIAPMLREVADRTPGMVRLMPDLPPITVPIWLVTHREVQDAPRIRLVRRILGEELAAL